jgi:hypothetical protein
LVQEYICAKEIVAKNISMDNKYIYVRNIWCKYICEKYILSQKDLLELKYCLPLIIQEVHDNSGYIYVKTKPSLGASLAVFWF